MSEAASKVTKINEAIEIAVPLKSMIAFVIVIAMSVWTYSQLTRRIEALESSQLLNAQETALNTEFRIKWPRGELGTRTEDKEQFLRIQELEKDRDSSALKIAKLEEEVIELRARASMK